MHRDPDAHCPLTCLELGLYILLLPDCASVFAIHQTQPLHVFRLLRLNCKQLIPMVASQATDCRDCRKKKKRLHWTEATFDPIHRGILKGVSLPMP